MITGRCFHTSVFLGDFVYVIGGSGPLKDCERYSLRQRKWAKVGSLKIGRERPGACVYSGRIYIGGGTGTDSFETYNPVSNSFSLLRLRLPIKGSAVLFSLPTGVISI